MSFPETFANLSLDIIGTNWLLRSSLIKARPIVSHRRDSYIQQLAQQRGIWLKY